MECMGSGVYGKWSAWEVGIHGSGEQGMKRGMGSSVKYVINNFDRDERAKNMHIK